MDILKINDDCLIQIFGKLNLIEQIAVAQAHTRFEALITSIWMAKYIDLSLSFAETDINDIEYEYFMQNIKSFVKTIRLKFLPRTKYKILCKHRFTNVIDFRFQEGLPKFLHDEDMLAFVEIFPSIQVFSPHGDLTGKHINQMVTLKHLTLTHCRLLKTSYLAAIIREIQLKSLKLNIFQMESAGIPFAPFRNNSVDIDSEVLLTEKKLNIFKNTIFCGSINFQ